MQKNQLDLFPQKPKKKRLVYLDYAAATPVDPRVIRAMAPYWKSNFANPSALYSLGVKNHEALLEARKKIAHILFTQPDSVIFTSGGTEANNLAIFGLMKNEFGLAEIKKNHIITTTIEHHSVLKPIQELEKQGAEVAYIPVNKSGEISVADIVAAIKPNTKLISIMYANNEIGSINPIAEIGRAILKYRQKNTPRPLHFAQGSGQATQFPYFHVDACQATGTLDLHIERLHVDLMTINGSKIYGPKGTGILFVRRGVPLQPIMLGGDQENGLRSGTENVPGIIGLARSLELTRIDFEKENKRQKKLRDYFWREINKKIPDIFLNGSELHGARLINNLNVQFSGLEAETLILYLDAYGIMAATGSACTTQTNQASHVLLACGLTTDETKSSLRFTIGKYTTKTDINYVLKFLPKIVSAIRAMVKNK